MGIDISDQLTTAVISMLLGIAAGIIYDVFRVIRKKTGLTASTVILDVVFCIIATSSLFLLGYSIGEGQTRAYMIVFSILGASAYFLLLSRVILAALGFVADMLMKIFGIIAFPFKLFAISLKKLLFFFKNFFYYKKKWYTISLVCNMSLCNDKKTNSLDQKKSAHHALRGNSNEIEKGRYYY